MIKNAAVGSPNENHVNASALTVLDA